MTNGVHLVVRTTREPLAIVMKRLGPRFAGWFNRKYGRVGHLFQDRFRSRPVDTDEYLLTLLRYVWANPVQAGLATRPEDSDGAAGASSMKGPVEFHDLPLSVRRRTVSELRTRGVRYTQIARATGPTLYAVRKLQAAAM